ncbi:MAG: DUF3429 domain-containing protein [Alphaproteobacteria bacterium]|nr:MAG: DUF3429 domain-containing protein [Alphaproteobacteria bacterium]
MLKDVPRTALVLGLAGLVPFWGLPILALVDPAWGTQALTAQRLYAACILSFLGAVHWGWALAEGQTGWTQLGWSVVPSLVGWLALLSPSGGWLLLLAGLGVAWFVDDRSVKAGQFPAWYGRLRVILTAGAVAGLGIGMAGAA